MPKVTGAYSAGRVRREGEKSGSQVGRSRGRGAEPREGASDAVVRIADFGWFLSFSGGILVRSAARCFDTARH